VLFVTRSRDSLWAPPRYNACKEHLLQVISNVWTQAVNYMSKMAIATPCNPWLGHPWFEGAHNMFKGGVEELTAKLAKVKAVFMLFIG
jgi:hypothetical protein